MHTTNTYVGFGGDINSTNKQIKKLSMLLNDSYSDNDISNTTSLDRNLDESLHTVECFGWFNNEFINKDADYRLKKLKLFREDSQMQLLAKSVFDFSMDDNERF